MKFSLRDCINSSVVVSYVVRMIFMMFYRKNRKTKKCQNPGKTKGFDTFCFGRSVEIRTPGLQYPKLARYQLRYTSKDIRL